MILIIFENLVTFFLDYSRHDNFRPNYAHNFHSLVSGVAEPGSLLAIMGASGAGKTTLLDILSAQNVGGKNIAGNIRVNGRNIESKIKNISAYCQQQDLFIGTLTVKEHLTFQVITICSFSFISIFNYHAFQALI